MPLRFIARYLVNSEKLIEKLSESYPIRRAAQLTVYVLFKGKAIGEQKIKQLKDSGSLERAKAIKDDFIEWKKKL